MARSKLSFATFNLQNLQLAGKPMYKGSTYTQAEYDGKIAWTANVLKRLDTDIIGFQELWHPDALKDAFDAAGLLEKYTLVSEDFGNSIGCAFAVRQPHTVVEHEWIKDFPKELVLKKRKPRSSAQEPDYKISVDADYFSRHVLRLKVKPVQGKKTVPPVILFNAHFKSKIPIWLDKVEAENPDIEPHEKAIGAALSNIRRTAEAAALRILVNQQTRGSNKPVVVMGDLNDAQHSVMASIVSQDPTYRLNVQSTGGRRSDAGLYAVADLQEFRSRRDVYYTHMYKDKRESLDHIFVSEQFYDHSKNRVWAFKEMTIMNDHLDHHDDADVSDHAPVKAVFEYFPNKR